MLEQINAPGDIKGFTPAQLDILAAEIRQTLIQTVSTRGGHLASNLGAVELTLALHSVLDAPQDKLVFDVGHQAYTHKLLTGRYRQFGTLRALGGISGFPRRCESEFDSFSVGHASTAISAALGMARARDLQGDDYAVVALVGDGALTGGMCYEALNDAGDSHTSMIIVLNDNAMSIARNVGALSRHLDKLRNSSAYADTKAAVKSRLARMPHIGSTLQRGLVRAKSALKRLFVQGSFFESFGITYMGPVDGHDIELLQRTLRTALTMDGPVLIHAITHKGRGYTRAEAQPDVFHGVAPFYVDTGGTLAPGHRSNGQIMAAALGKLAETDPRITAITAAMPQGTHLSDFAAKYPARCFDVGIAEEHAVTMAAGMAAVGMRPYVALYSSFLQRAYDQLQTDVCLDGLPVCVLIDRAGISGEDGATHQGIFDISFLRPIPGLTIMSPRSGAELELMVRYAHELNAPCAIRYAKDCDESDTAPAPLAHGRWELMNTAADAEDSACGTNPANRSSMSCTLIAVGCMVNIALSAARALRERGIFARVINARFIQPMDMELLSNLSGEVFTLEDNACTGGFGDGVRGAVDGARVRLTQLAFPNEFIEHGTRTQLFEKYGMDAAGIARRVIRQMEAWK